ncbi:FkbM family methyltransferase [Leptolyngbya sp. NIES-2104]|uniref:FkbM family methyltransferase n=1 Tax=Leptolyngbya sp. NIES-2104 TaxID=1552121 RepID=UPI0006EC67A1|nr:FkbM family methyltransferase [Leptolyngbya sp. NIES-2104]GAP93930.1 methyltransferase, FkbM family [Leptolyngbya sp. NIES-2104]
MVQQVLSLSERYYQYLEHCEIGLQRAINQKIQQSLENTNWDEPQSALERNNIAVAILIEAEQCEPSFRGVLLESAIELLNPVVHEHPLCVAHFALIQSLVGNTSEAINLAFSAFIQTLGTVDTVQIGAVYLPERALLKTVLQAETGSMQALYLLTTILQQAQLVFYNNSGLRFLNLSTQILPPNRFTALKFGIASLVNSQWEGLAVLHHAQQLEPDHPQVLQALFLAYRGLRQIETATHWLKVAQDLRSHYSTWNWTEAAIDSDITYLPFENCTLAVEASFRSIVTSVLLAEGDWFEREMEFWRSQIQPGMTVIDVGANVGVYTFSAASRVGKEGCVIAVEPFSGCVHCLEETRQINDFSQVRICAGAASDRVGTVKLSLQSASELNEVVDADSNIENAEVVKCFTLDSLIEAEQIDRINLLKLDAEGHEMQVLQGSDRILTEFRPVLLYENIAGSKGSNLPVAEYLIAKNYRLFRYQPFVQELIEIRSLEDLQGNLNVIALPHSI